MAESEHSQENIASIRTQLDNIERLVRFSVASNPNSRAAIKEILSSRANAPNVYLALSERPKSQDTLVKELKMSQASISKICKYLYNQGLIWRTANPSNPKKTLFLQPDLEKTLHISKIAERLIKDRAKGAK